MKGKTYPLGLQVTADLLIQPHEKLAALTVDYMRSWYGVSRPAIVDWQKKDGKNYVTTVKNQAGCGACVAFAMCATVESAWMIYKNDGIRPDLSEADLFFRGGGNCQRGWTLEKAVSRLQSHGVGYDECYPYPDGPIYPCIDDLKKIIKISGATRITSQNGAKDWIAAHGPVSGAMHVDSDFFDYMGGIYTPEYGSYVGDHAIEVIGYDDTLGCWICKNSWGTEWGEDGFFKISYGECGLFTDMVGQGVTVGEPGPGPTPPPTPGQDVVLTKNGKVQVLLNVNRRPKNSVKSLVVNGVTLWPIDSMKPGKYNDVGTGKKGDKLIFEINTTSGLVHLTASAFGFTYWYLKSDNILFTVHQP